MTRFAVLLVLFAPAYALAQEQEPGAQEPEAEAEVAVDDGAASAAEVSTSEYDTEPLVEEPVSSGGGSHSMNPDISFVSDVALAYFSDEDRQAQTGGHDPTQNGFNLQQLEASISGAVDPYFRFDANLVFSLFGVEIEEAYATTLGLPVGLQVRAGQFLTRFGRINNSHPHAWDMVDQPFAMGRVFGGEGNRGLGLELSWLTPLPWYVELVSSVTTADGASTARSFYGGQSLGVDTPADFQYTVAAKQFHELSDDWSLAWGISGAFGPNGTGRNNRTDIVGADAYLKYRPITSASDFGIAMQTEWIYRRRQIPADVLSDVSGYAQLNFQWNKEWQSALRYDFGSAPIDLDGAVQADSLDPEWTNPRHRASLSATLHPTEFSRIRVQGSGDWKTWEREPVWALFTAVEFVIGAHGAHAF